MCGANLLVMVGQPVGDGSSPLVRGKLQAVLGQRAKRRIIPACAGQTQPFGTCTGSCPDHPRLCGANLDCGFRLFVGVGSSPLVRGKLRRPPGHDIQNRIIPACAGQTYRPAREFRDTPDHPRLCGANMPPSVMATPRYGSSPLVRGKLDSTIDVWAVARIIPACAGQTQTIVFSTVCGTDHPRLCGANTTQ